MLLRYLLFWPLPTLVALYLTLTTAIMIGTGLLVWHHQSQVIQKYKQELHVVEQINEQILNTLTQQIPHYLLLQLLASTVQRFEYEFTLAVLDSEHENISLQEIYTKLKQYRQELRRLPKNYLLAGVSRGQLIESVGVLLGIIKEFERGSSNERQQLLRDTASPIGRIRGLLVNLEQTLAAYSSKLTTHVYQHLQEDQDMLRTIQNLFTQLNTYLFMAFGVALLLILILQNYISSILRYRMQQLKDYAASIAKGNFDIKLNLPVKDDTGQLAISMQAMSARLQTTLAQLQLTAQAAKTLQHEAETANHAKSTFLANMSHELRTPMNAIIGLSTLAMQSDMSAKVRDYVIKISSSSQSLLRIINDILDFSKIEAGKLEFDNSEFLLRDVFDRLADMFRVKTTEKSVELIIYIAEECRYELIGDALRLEQILLNLISNAFKFTDEGEVEVRVKTLTESIDKVVLEFCVKDTGIGMSEDRLNNLFQPFTQADSSIARKFGGTGLGLSISKRLVEMMGGKIWVNSKLGVGSEFYFSIALKRKLGAEVEDMISPEDMKHLKVLVVDDNESARNAIQTILKIFDFQSMGVNSGQQAIHIIKRAIANKNPYRLLLIDSFMPVVDGLHIIQQIQSNIPGDLVPKIILMVPFDREDKLRIAGSAMGINAYLPKPINCSILFDTIMQIFNKEVTKVFRMSKKFIDVEYVMQKIGGARVLLVEDNAINRQVAGEILESVGLIVDIAYDGLEVMDKLAASMYDAILMDIQMPGMDGYEASRQVRNDSRYEKLPIIAMTAHAMSGDKEKCLNAGMNDHVSKPINCTQLYNTLINWIIPREGIGVATHIQRKPVEETIVFPKYLLGIDIEAGLNRVNNNRRLYRSLLFEFQRDYAPSSEQIHALLSAGDLKAAARLIHTVKGLASNISSNIVFEKAVALEQIILTNTNFSEQIKIALSEFTQAIQQVMQAIATMKANQITNIVIHEQTKTEINISPSELEKILSLMMELSDRLKRNAFDAQESFDNLKPLLGNVASQVLQNNMLELEERMDRIDFKGAQKLLRSIAQFCGISLDH